MMELKTEYKMIELNEIPVGWEISTLEKVTTEINDGVHSTPNYKEKGIPFYSVENITKNDFKNVKYISKEDHLKYSKRSRVEKDDILMTRIGSIGDPKLINWDVNASIYVSLALLKINKERILPSFLYQYMKSTIFKKEILRKSLLQAAPMKINLGDIGKIPLIMPSLKEQQKIAEILSTVDKQIEQTDQLIEKTKELKKGLMQQLLTKGIGHINYKHTELGEIPVEWGVFKVEDIATVTTGGKDTKDKDENGIYPFFVRSQTIEHIDSYSFDGEAILTAGDGVGVGKVFHYVKGKFDFHQRVYKISDFKNIEGRYLYYYFSNNFYNRAMKYNAKTSVDSVRRSMITQMEIPVPTVSEQKKIISILSFMDKDIKGYEEEKVKYEELKKGLMQQLLTGKTRVKVD